MQSKLLAKLEEEARTSKDRVSWARSVCRAASQFARQGLTSEAAAAIESVRQAFGSELDAEVAAWLMLAEGVCHFTAGNQPAALDRIRRADGIAVAFNSSPARPTCAAWHAHIEFNLSNFDEMHRHLQRALEEADPSDHQALSRASLVMADAYHYSGHFSLARPWYDATRNHASAEGDEATISAMLYNVAAFRAANVLLADALGECIPDEAHRAKLEASSAANYDNAVGTRSFESLTVLLSGQLLLVDKREGEAFLRLRSIEPYSLPIRLRSVLLCDLALCAARLGRLDDARTYSQTALQQIGAKMDEDDAAYAWSRLSRVHVMLGESDAAAAMATSASNAMAQLRATRDSLKSRLDTCVESVQSRRPGK
jgi:tetratricopeptide (TPR) repeat protein